MSRRNLVIAISGTPGAGKTRLALFLAKKLHFSRLDLHRHYREIATGYDTKKHCYVIDLKKLEALVRKERAKKVRGIIVDSHVAHLLPKRRVDICLVLTCSTLKTLQKRLQRRGYSTKKIRENLDAEIFQVCLLEAREKGHQVLAFDTDVKKEEILKQVRKKMGDE